MALSITVTKKSVTEVMDGMWIITLNMTCLDGGAEVINRDFTISYKLKADLASVFGPMKQEMQDTIDAYKSSKAIFDHAKLAAVVKYMNNNLAG